MTRIQLISTLSIFSTIMACSEHRMHSLHKDERGREAFEGGDPTGASVDTGGGDMGIDSPGPVADWPEWDDTGEIPEEPTRDEPPALETCDAEVLTTYIRLDFPERSGCAFGREGNLEAVDGRIQARSVQLDTRMLGDGAAVCDIRFEFAASEGGLSFPLRYDDQMLFALNRRVIFATDERIVHTLETDSDGFRVYDWDAIKGLEMDFYPSPWSVGTTDVVDLPSHDVAGDAHIEIEDEALSRLRAGTTDRLDFSLVSFGDNDSTDCGHTGLSFWVEIDSVHP